MAGSTASSINTTDLLDALVVLGADRRRLLTGAGLGAELLADPDARVPSAKILNLFRLAEKQLRDPFVGLHAGRRVHPRGPLFYLLFSARRLSEGFDLLARFARVTLDSQRLTVAIAGGEASLTIDLGDPDLRESHHAVDYAIGAILEGIRQAVPGTQPVGVDVAHPMIGDRAEAERAYGCPVRFGFKRSVLRFASAALKRTPAGSNPAIAAQIKTSSAALLARVTSDRAEDRAADVIRLLLVDGIRPDRDIVARRLFMGERTLKRRLQDEGTTFKKVRDRVRVETAQALLSNRQLKVESVARSVGFADTASFSKAFARWSGVSPARYRAGLPARGVFGTTPRSGRGRLRPVGGASRSLGAGR
ncbi:MAG TPA: AraC family transcriptional regulator [Dongiaceae bacterium]|nr:AraC family transcriptional regulator [Dongiaceae bacterium]